MISELLFEFLKTYFIVEYNNIEIIEIQKNP